MSHSRLFTAFALLSSPLLAWELASTPLPSRVAEASVVVVAHVERLHSKRDSPIAGVGQVWDVTLRVEDTLKGKASPTLRATFVEASVQEWRTFESNRSRVYLLEATSDPNSFLAPSRFESVLLPSELPAVRAALQPRATPAPTASHHK